MVYDYENRGKKLRGLVRDAALQTNEVELITQVYEDSIKYLDKVKAAASLQCELALAKIPKRPERSSLDVPPNTSNFHRPVIMAQMYLKIGPVREFQNILQGVVSSCIDNLSDTVEWKDSQNLVFLAKIIYMLGKIVKSGEKLTRVARILLSAQLSRLDPAVSQKSDDGDTVTGLC
ncbi:uncharacterized protein FTOL_06726 [Fusarium torulosum]|uniref:Uncharacterized protein n=1 Tax=Fusarium torulosum TaxID=33205 RepID=A0AAE8SJ39_9HYPO|nr:uncharacterized protein FTOL_06726 [Fusarium torulosum]